VVDRGRCGYIGVSNFGAVQVRIEGAGGIWLRLDGDGDEEDDVELVPAKVKEAEKNRVSTSGCGVQR
jgi:hypothetical protein